MNREQAERMLDAYENVILASKRVNVAGLHDSVREVILDAMSDAETRYYPVYVNAPRWPSKYDGPCPDFTPKVTWTGEATDYDGVTRPMEEVSA